jgi:hypothetical protein
VGGIVWCLRWLAQHHRGSHAAPKPPTPQTEQQLGEADAVALDGVCRRHGVGLLLLRSYGLAGYVRPSVPEVRVVESRPDSKVDDLRWAGWGSGGDC